MSKSAVVAGHLCLDFLPDLSRVPYGQFMQLFQPGQLVQAGPALFATGGAVSNTGLALHKLGIPTRLVAKVGQDFFGGIVQNLIHAVDARLAEGIRLDPASHTSYSVVINPPGMDRAFLHAPGANDIFTARDIDYRLVEQASLFHFGYPPVMRAMYQNGGKELARVFQKAKEGGATTSLDMAFPDPSSDSGRADWSAILRKTLPFVDIFLPSIEEILFMLWPDVYLRLEESGGILQNLHPSLLDEVSSTLIQMGAKIVGLKLGERGFYLRTTADFCRMGRAAPENLAQWQDQQLWTPCFQVDVVGTTGAGDATIAGFLAALLRDFSPAQAARMAVAVGACNVEAADALSGIRTWEETLRRIDAGWERRADLEPL